MVIQKHQEDMKTWSDNHKTDNKRTNPKDPNQKVMRIIQRTKDNEEEEEEDG